MNKYQSYKPSGVEWIGEIPEKWRISKFKYVSKLYTGNSLNDEQKLLYESDDENHFPYVSSKDIDLNTRNVNYNNGLRIPKENNPLKVSPKDSFLLCVEGGSSGRKMVYLDREVCFVNKLCSFKSVENTRFQYYFIQSSNFQDKFRLSLSGLIGGVSISTLRDFELVLPSIQEQHQIVQFLDEKTELIDKLISTKERKITLLKEQRTSLINQVVTKGLNPNVKMKDSGVEWIGEIPEHWTIPQTKYITQIFRGKFTHRPRNDERFYNGEYPFIQTGDIVSSGKYLTKYTQTLNELGLSVSKEFPIGTLVMTISGNIGDVSILKIRSCFPDSILGFFPLSSTNVEYLYYLFTSLKQEFLKNSTVSTQMNLNVERVGSIQVPVPPIDEQLQIVEFLDSKTKEIDDLVQLEQKKIDLLKEYRQSLISEVVTGKVKTF
jgi:type I restriction enzyme S subunit